jgi:hypothetical protein
MPGVVFFGSSAGTVYAYSTAAGKALWKFDTARAFDTVNGVPASGGTINSAGPVVSGGMLFVPSGYSDLGAGARGNVLLAFGPSSADTLAGRWRLLAAEDVRADGSVARYPWGRHPIGSIVAEGGSCYLQIMSSDTPSFEAGDKPIGEQMKSALVSTYIAYSGPCTIDDAAGSVTLKVEAAWRTDYVGTEQKRFFRFEQGRLLFGPAPNSMRVGGETLTRRLTLERVR